jgi:plastocyanin
MTRPTLNPIARLGSVVCVVLFASASVTAAETREFFIKTVHIDGKANIHGDSSHPAEAFPSEALPAGHGLMLTKPNEDGVWKMRAFAFVPSQIVVNQGDDVRLHFIGVQGTKHTIHVEGQGIDKKFTLARGRMETVDITSTEAGIIEIECYDHVPVMRAELVVLPRIK